MADDSGYFSAPSSSPDAKDPLRSTAAGPSRSVPTSRRPPATPYSGSSTADHPYTYRENRSSSGLFGLPDMMHNIMVDSCATLSRNNLLGTFNPAVKWIESYERPFKRCQNRTAQEYGIARLQTACEDAGLPAFYCAHAWDTRNPLAKCIMHFAENRKIAGENVNVLIAEHNCPYYIIIGPAKRYVLDRFGLKVEECDDGDVTERASSPISAPTSQTSTPLPQARPVGSNVPVPSRRDAASAELSTSVIPQGKKLNRRSTLTDEQLRRSKNTDQAAADRILEFHQAGAFEDSPQDHPAHPNNNLYVLQPYAKVDAVTLENYCSTRIVSQALRWFTSTMGIPQDGFDALLDASVKCPACERFYDAGGFLDHVYTDEVSARTCIHTANLAEISPFPKVPAPLHILPRTFPRRMTVQDHNLQVLECAEDAVTSAWFLWASHVGVPGDIWTVLTTTAVRCKRCSLVRTHAAHDTHFDADGKCSDPGPAEGIISR